MRRAAVVAIVAGGAAALAIGAMVVWASLRPPSAEATANAYLDALMAGDSSAATAQLTDDAIAGLDPDIGLKDAAEWLTDARVTEIDEEANNDGSVSVAYVASVLGDESTGDFSMRQTADGWRVGADALGSITSTTSLGDSTWVGISLVPADRSVTVLPAAYTVAPAPAGLVQGETLAAVTPGAQLSLELDPTLSPAAESQAQTQLDSYADQCAAATTAVPERCGIRVPWAADLAVLESIALRVDEYPVVVLADDSTTFRATGGVLTVAVTGLTRGGDRQTFDYRADAWSLQGAVEFAGNEMVLKVF